VHGKIDKKIIKAKKEIVNKDADNVKFNLNISSHVNSLSIRTNISGSNQVSSDQKKESESSVDS
jgi:hypothetical protein